MITIYPYERLGHANHGWLDARHHFSFGGYVNPNRIRFGALRVINDDTIDAGAGFDTHPHKNMEIITYVRKGAITHKDSMDNVGRTEAGDVQVMSAGTGVFHSEYNAEPENTKLYQIWIEPDKENVEPRWDAKQFPKNPAKDALSVLVSGMPEHEKTGALYMHQDAAIYGGRLTQDTTILHPIKHQAYILVSQGEVTVNDARMKQGDGAEVIDLETLTIQATTDAEILVIDAPHIIEH